MMWKASVNAIWDRAHFTGSTASTSSALFIESTSGRDATPNCHDGHRTRTPHVASFPTYRGAPPARFIHTG